MITGTFNLFLVSTGEKELKYMIQFFNFVIAGTDNKGIPVLCYRYSFLVEKE